jgi:hypothetical protein
LVLDCLVRCPFCCEDNLKWLVTIQIQSKNILTLV